MYFTPLFIPVSKALAVSIITCCVRSPSILLYRPRTLWPRKHWLRRHSLCNTWKALRRLALFLCEKFSPRFSLIVRAIGWANVADSDLIFRGISFRYWWEPAKQDNISRVHLHLLYSEGGCWWFLDGFRSFHVLVPTEGLGFSYVANLERITR